MPQRFMLDTNIVSDMVRNPEGPCMRHWQSIGYPDLHISAIVASELCFGVVKKGSERLRRSVETFLETATIECFDVESARFYATVRHELEGSGTVIGPNDLFIAAHALALDMVLVTNNVREFSRVPGLKLENWLETATEEQ